MKKLFSRKLLAFFIWSVFMGIMVFGNPNEIVKEAIPYYGGITMIYIGFQALQDFIPAILSVIKAWKSKEKEDV